MATVRKIAPLTQTVAVNNGNFKRDAFVQGWDKQPAQVQSMDRIAKRAAQGRKLTPIGRGTLRPSGRKG